MRLLCTGDFHLGAGSDYGRRPGDRLADQAQVCDRIVQIAREEDVAAVLFAGDAFERRTPTPAELMVWRGFVEQLEASEIRLWSIAGNHDVARADLPTGLDVVDHCIRTPDVRHIGEGIALATLPWTPPAELIAARGGGDRDDLNEQVAEHLIEAARGLRDMVDGPAILLAHWSVTGASLPSGLDVGLLREPVLDYDALAETGFEQIVLGHIHKPQMQTSELGEQGFYVGSPMTLNFGETSCEHGVWVFDTARPSDTRFIPIESRPFVTITADLTTHPETKLAEQWGNPRGIDETDILAAELAEHFPLTDAVVRIRYKATAEQARRVDQGALRELVMNAGAQRLYAIQAEVTRSDRARVAGVDESIDERQAMRRYVEGWKLEEAEPLVALHERYLEEARA